MVREVYEQAWRKLLHIKEKAKSAWRKHPRLYKIISICLFLIYSIFAIFFSGQPFSRPFGNEWISHAPSAKQVIDDLSGWGEIDTPARQAAAFEILKDAIQKWTGLLDARRMSPRAAAKLREYASALGRQPYGLKFDDGACSGENCIRWKYYQKQWGYSLDLGFAAETLGRYFPIKYRIAYIQESKTPRKVVRSPVTSFIMGTIAFIAYAVGGFVSSFFFIFWTGVGAFSLYGAFGLYKKFFKGKEPDDPWPPLTDNYGSASFAPMDQLLRLPFPPVTGVFLGKSSEPARHGTELDGPGAPVITTPEYHTLVVARTRTGKGTRVIVPTLLRYSGNLFVIDPKGENAAITARARRDGFRQTVHIINPWGVLSDLYASYGFTPATYNPLDILNRNDPNVVATARRLAHAICPVSGRQNDAFWQQSAAAILTGVFLWLADQPGESKTLARAREIVTLSRRAFTEQFLTKMAVSTAFDGAIKEMVGNLIDLADQTYTGIMANLTMTTDFISDPQLKSATNASTFSLTDMRDKPMTLYLVIPPEQMDTQKTWLRLLIASTTQCFRHAVHNTDRRRCMMLIDEFPALGKLQDLPTDIATMAGYGLDYTLIVQGINQLNSVYDKDAGTILNNCAYKWYCNVTDLEGAKYLSDSLGEATVRTVGKSQSAGTSGGGSATSGESTTWGEKGRKLLTPDEIITLGRDVAIAFQPTGLPMYLKPIDYWNLTKAFAPGPDKNLSSLLFWQPSLVYDPNPYVNAPAGAQWNEPAQERSVESDTQPPPFDLGLFSARWNEMLRNLPSSLKGAGSGSAEGNQTPSDPQPPSGEEGPFITNADDVVSQTQPPPDGQEARPKRIMNLRIETLPRRPANTAKGVFLGKSSKPHLRDVGLEGPGAPIVTSPAHHTLIVSPSSRTSTRVAIPTLLRYAGNMFVIDPNGMYAAITARTRRDTMNQTIHIVNPWGIQSELYGEYGFTSATYNPLDILEDEFPHVISSAWRLANAICPVTSQKHETNAYWEEAATTVLAAIFVWLAFDSEDARTLAHVREIITLDQEAFTTDILPQLILATVSDPMIYDKLSSFSIQGRGGHTFVAKRLALATEFIDDPNLTNGTNTSTFSMGDLGRTDTTLYIVVQPAAFETHQAWLRLLIATATYTFQYAPHNDPEWRACMMLVDKFPWLGKFYGFHDELPAMAEWGLDLALFVDTIEQLKVVYGNDADAIMSSCAYQWYCDITGDENTKTLSDIFAANGARFTPDEIAKLGPDLAFVFQPKNFATYVKPIDYWNLTTAFADLKDNKLTRNLYWEPPLTYDKNPFAR